MGMRGITPAACCWLSGLAAALSGGDGETLLCALAIVVAVCGKLLHGRAWRSALACGIAFALATGYGALHGAGDDSRLPEAGRMPLSGVLVSQPVLDGDRVRFTLATAEREKVAVTVRLAAEEERAVAARWQRGDEARLTGELALPRGPRNFGQFDYADYLAKRGIHRVYAVEGASGAGIQAGDTFRLEKVFGRVERYRLRIAERIAVLFPGRQAGFMQGMLIGWTGDMDGELYQAFSRLGLTHIIAISGLHVGIVVGGWIGLMRLFRVTRETAVASALGLIPLYMLLTGGAPSVIRAGLMAMMGLVLWQRGRMKDAMQLVAATAVGMTLWQPLWMHNAGFQLSFLVTAGLIAGVPVILRLLPSAWPKWLAGSLAITLCAQMVSFPLTIFYFNHYSLLSGLANLVLVPVFSTVVLPGGYLALLVSPISTTWARWLAQVPAVLNDWSFRLVDLGADMSEAHTIWPSPPLGALLLYYLLFMGFARGITAWRGKDGALFPLRARRGKRLALLSLCALTAWFGGVYHLAAWSGRGTVAFLDVGQGDAILIRTPANRTVLVDGGGTVRFHRPDETWRLGREPYEVGKDLLVPLLMKRGVRQIDWMIVSHGDADHVGGLAAVAARLPTKAILFNGTLPAGSAAEPLFRTALAKGVPLYPVGAGQSLVVDRHTRLDFLFPETGGPVHVSSDQNARSVVFVLTMQGRRFLFTGDMDAGAEREAIRLLRLAGKNPAAGEDQENGQAAHPVDVLKVAHHGSKSSTSELWLNRWKPGLAVISAGVNNIYRHPSGEVLERLARHRIPVLRTDRHGEIQLKITPREIVWRTFLDPEERAVDGER